MKIIDCSQTTETNGLQDLARRAQELLPIQLSKDPAKLAQGIVIQQLKINTNSKYLLLRNILLEPLNESIPMVLIGPTGIIIINPTDIKGIFKAQEDNWYEMKGKERKYQPSRPNLVYSTYQMTKAITRKLDSSSIPDMDVQGVLIFTSPGTHVDAVRPSVRIVLADGLKRFASQIMQNPIQLTNLELEKIKNLFNTGKEIEGDKPEAELRDQFDFIEDSPPAKPVYLPTAPSSPPLAGLTSKFKLTTGQWIFLGILAVFQILLLIGIILLFIM